MAQSTDSSTGVPENAAATSTPERAAAAADLAPPSAPTPADGRQRTLWSPRQHLLFLMLWWAIIVVYYVAFTSPLWRFSKDWVVLDMVYGARYVVLAAGMLGALSAERRRLLWFAISAAGSMLFLVLSLLLLGGIRAALGS